MIKINYFEHSNKGLYADDFKKYNKKGYINENHIISISHIQNSTQYFLENM